MHNSRIKKSFFLVHTYMGLILGLLITLICISGVVIVYKPELEKLSVKKLAYVHPETNTIHLQTMLDNVQKEYPDLQISNMVLYGGKDCAYSFRTTSSKEKGRIQVYVNQYNGKVLGIDKYRYKVFQWLYDFHVKLLLKKNGTSIVSILGYILILLIITGVFITPKRRLFHFGKGIKKTARFFKIHTLIGIFASAFIFIIALSGSYFGFKELYQSMFEKAFSGTAVVAAPTVEPYSGKPVSLDVILQTAQNTLKDAKPMLIFFPKDNKSVFSVRMLQKGDWERTGSNHIYIHPITGKVVKTNLWKDKSTAEKITRAMYFIHFGTFWGNFSRVLWMLIGTTIPFLYITGFIVWINSIRSH